MVFGFSFCLYSCLDKRGNNCQCKEDECDDRKEDGEQIPALVAVHCPAGVCLHSAEECPQRQYDPQQHLDECRKGKVEIQVLLCQRNIKETPQQCTDPDEDGRQHEKKALSCLLPMGIFVDTVHLVHMIAQCSCGAV